MRRRLGIDVVRRGIYEFERHINRLGVTLVLDVGAHNGECAGRLRGMGFTGRIVSFEPVAESFGQLSVAAQGDDRWTVVHSAIGSACGDRPINVSDHSEMSSFRQIRSDFVASSAWAAVTRREVVPVTTIDTVFSHYVTPSDVVLLKLDIQGFEDQALLGAGHSLRAIRAVQLEAAVSGLYDGEPTLWQHVAALSEYGFRLVDLCDAFRDEHSRLVQVDAFFERT
jgi:FkbM family methyltransferase